jgi:hypothetical protein
MGPRYDARYRRYRIRHGSKDCLGAQSPLMKLRQRTGQSRVSRCAAHWADWLDKNPVNAVLIEQLAVEEAIARRARRH